MNKVIIIAAIAKNNTIGKNGKMPWHISEDLKFFKQTTAEAPMIMGRKTRQSFGRKPLPKRPHLIVSRDKNFTAEGSVIFSSIEDALSYAKNNYPNKDIYIIGGAQIYKQTINLADEVILSEIQNEYDGDCFFPEFDRQDFEVEILEDHTALDIPFIIKKYIRK